jgi:PAS domain-containing protein
MLKVQGETLDNLSEAVAVFGSDGRLRLFNPAFGRMWKLDPGALR